MPSRSDGYQGEAVNRLAILNYHGIETPGSESLWQEGERTYALRLEAFRAQILSLKERGFRCLLPDDLDAWNRGRIGEPCAMITFDDGLACQTEAVSVLEEAGYRGVFFVSAGLLGQERMMQCTDLRDLAKRGHVVGSHGWSHVSLPSLSLARQIEELCRSRELLEEKTGVPVTSFSIPRGFSNRLLEQLVFRTGYRYVFSSRYDLCFPSTGRRVLPRIAIRRSDTLDDFRELTEGRLRMRIWSERIKETVRNTVPSGVYDGLAKMKESLRRGKS